MPAPTLSLPNLPFVRLMPMGNSKGSAYRSAKSLACATGSCHIGRRDGGVPIMPGLGRQKSVMRQKGFMPPAYRIGDRRATKRHGALIQKVDNRPQESHRRRDGLLTTIGLLLYQAGI